MGVITYTLGGPAFFFDHITAPIYNMDPDPDQPADLAFKNTIFGFVQVHIGASIRTGDDYGITTTAPHVVDNLKLLSSSVTIWGVPADPSHDGERGSAAFSTGCLDQHGPSGNTCPSDVEPKSFLSNPTQCGAATTVSLTLDSWQAPGAFVTPLLSTPQQMVGCERLKFEPSLTLQPASTQAGAPSAYEVHVHVPQSDVPTTLATPHVRKVLVHLPEGVSVSPSAGDGLAGCSDEQIGLNTAADPTCPDASKVGTVQVSTPLLPKPIDGVVYQGTQTPEHLLRIFIVAKGFGTLIKLPGSVDLDPNSGQITTTVDNNPQLPFSDFVLKFNGGPRAPLSNPRTCGPKTTTATMTSWGGQTVTTSDTFQITKNGQGAPCPDYGFTPDFIAGVSNPVAGADSPFTLYFARDDEDQELRSLAVNLPPGLLAHLADVPLCSSAEAAAGTCPETSRVGTVTTSAGPGSQPFFLKGSAYITEGYNGKPFGMAIVVRAKAGPLDLGNVVVRASLDIRNNGSVRVVSDPLPSILQGIPLQVRSARVDVDRNAFIVNPTSCSPGKVNGQISSTQGAVANVSSPFELAECKELPFHPKLTITVGRKGHTKPGTSTPLTTVLTQPPGQAGLKKVDVTLPLTLNALLPVVENACTLDEFHAGHCEKARTGTATAITPLLKQPLTGGVYFVKRATKGGLPNLMVALRGQVSIDLTGKVTIPGGTRLATSFDTIPDAPVSKFTLKLVDGAHGPLGVVDNLCSAKARRARVQIAMRGQNGALLKTRPHMHIRGCTKAKARSKR